MSHQRDYDASWRIAGGPNARMYVRRVVMEKRNFSFVGRFWTFLSITTARHWSLKNWMTYLQDWKMTCLQDFATCLRKMLMTFTAILENKHAHFQLGIAICNLDYYPFEKDSEQLSNQVYVLCSSLLSPHLLKYVYCNPTLPNHCHRTLMTYVENVPLPPTKCDPWRPKSDFTHHIVQRLRMIIYGFYTSIDISQEKIINGARSNE